MQNGNDPDMERFWTNRGMEEFYKLFLGLLISSNMVRLRGTRRRGTNLHKATKLRRVFDDNYLFHLNDGPVQPEVDPQAEKTFDKPIPAGTMIPSG